MKRPIWNVLALVLSLGLAGCEWEGGGEDDGWSTTGIDSDISGTYKAADGGFAVKTGSGTATRTETIGTGNGSNRSFSRTLAELSIVPGSVSVTATKASDSTTMTMHDNDGDGIMAGDGSGNMNYGSGSLAVTFSAGFAPKSGTPVNATYRYSAAGSSEAIHTFTVHQNGNKIRIVTNLGGELEGSLGVAAKTTNPDATITVTMYQFSASGTQDGKSVKMTGVFNVTDGTMEGTWIEDGGPTGSISAQR